jgi:tRNA (cmo5U34)-methyltransferase
MSKFDFNKIDDFDSHIHLSIPNYDWLVNEIIQYSKYFIDDNTNVYDIGCSTGKMLEAIRTPSAQFYGVDNSKLLPQSTGNLHFENRDLNTYDSFMNASFVTSVFTLQFLPRNTAMGIINKVNKSLNHRGAFIVCEKVYATSAMLQDIINSKYYEFKEQSFKVNEILIKERQLRESMKLNSVDFWMEQLSIIGKPELFWRSHNFIGIIVIKEQL